MRDAAPATGRHAWVPYALLAAGACLMGVLFLHLGNEVAEGETVAFDTWLLAAGRDLRTGHGWVAEVMRDLSGIGSLVTLALLTAGACGYLAITRSWIAALVVAVAVASGAVAMLMLKAGFARVRPDVAFAQLVADGPSFPSGHSSMSAVVFLTLGALVARMHRRRRERAYVIAFAVVLTLLVGTSRAVMGVHWATDVVGGWALGVAWATSCLLVLRWLER